MTDVTAITPGAQQPARRWHRRRLVRAGFAGAVLLAAYVAWSTTMTFTLRHSIDIPARPDQVWAVLADIADYPQWNPFIVSVRGPLREGERLHNVLRDAHGGTLTFDPTLLTVQPDHELRWIGYLGIPGLVDGEHRFVIEHVAPERVRFTQQEDFRGVLVPFLHGYLTGRTLPQFVSMDYALAQRVADAAARR